MTKPILGFKSFRAASNVLASVELIHMMHMIRQDRRQGHLSRSGTVEPRSFRQVQRFALAVPYAGDAAPLGQALLGAAFLFRVGAIRALLPEAGRRPSKLTDRARQLLLLVRR